MGAADTDATAAQPPWPAGAAWIDGWYCPVEQASISVLDLGVTRSDAAYDVVHVWDGRFYRLDAHLDRFAASLARLRLNPGHGRAEIEAFLHGCVRHAGLREAYVSMTCTRGRLAAGSRDLRTARNTFYCFAVPFVWISSPDQQAAGASMRVSEITLTEGPGFNVFAYVDGRWLTPASGTLPGITRRSVIELAGQAGPPVEEGRLTPDDLRRATEVLVTSTAGGIMPVTVIDGQPVGTGAPGPLTRQLRDRYWASHHDPRYSTPVRYDETGFGTPTGEAGLQHLSTEDYRALVVVPITPETEQVLPRAEMLRLRENVNDMLLDLLDSDSLRHELGTFFERCYRIWVVGKLIWLFPRLRWA